MATMQLHHHRLLAAIVLGGLVAGAPLATAAIPAVRPNIVFILADDLGHADLGCTGSDLFELFNLREDPAELMDLAQSNAEKVTELRRELRQWQRDIKIETYEELAYPAFEKAR